MSNLLIENLPYVAAAAGAVAGSASEYVAQRIVMSQREALAGEDASIVDVDPNVSMWARVRTVGGSTLAAAGVVIGLLNGYAWQPDTTEEVPPYIGVVTDRSGTTVEVVGGVNDIVEGFDDEGFDATAFVARSGTVEILRPEQVKGKKAWGNAPLSEAFNQAVGVADKEEQAAGVAVPRSRAIVAVVNDNPFGDQAGIEAMAKASRMPVYIVNVAKESDPANDEMFEAIAENTGGEFWKADNSNAEEISAKVQESLEKNQLKKDDDGNKLPIRIAAGVTSAWLAFQAFRRRRNESTGLSVTDVRES